MTKLTPANARWMANHSKRRDERKRGRRYTARRAGGERGALDADHEPLFFQRLHDFVGFTPADLKAALQV